MRKYIFFRRASLFTLYKSQPEFARPSSYPQPTPHHVGKSVNPPLPSSTSIIQSDRLKSGPCPPPTCLPQYKTPPISNRSLPLFPSRRIILPRLIRSGSILRLYKNGDPMTAVCLNLSRRLKFPGEWKLAVDQVVGSVIAFDEEKGMMGSL